MLYSIVEQFKYCMKEISELCESHAVHFYGTSICTQYS